MYSSIPTHLCVSCYHHVVKLGRGHHPHVQRVATAGSGHAVQDGRGPGQAAGPRVTAHNDLGRGRLRNGESPAGKRGINKMLPVSDKK